MSDHFLPRADALQQADIDAYHSHSTEFTLLVNDFLLRYLNTVYQEFSGDITKAIVLGEIAHHCISQQVRQGKTVNCSAEEVRECIRTRHRLQSCNPYSISEATGIPRETVRRKFSELEQEGYIEKTEKQAYILTPRVAERFVPDFNLRLYQGFKNLFVELKPLMDAD